MSEVSQHLGLPEDRVNKAIANLKPHRGGSVVEVARLPLPAFTVEIKELEEWFGLELAWIVVDEY